MYSWPEVIPLILIVKVSVTGGEGCDESLGLANNEISAGQISSSLDLSRPDQARLNNRDSAWCFQWSKLNSSGGHISWQVDLLTPRLVSGLQLQGPPSALAPPAYISYIGLTVAVSEDGRTWSQCCGEEETTFYLDDKKDEVDTVGTNSFPDLVAARYVRLMVSTSLRWVGNDNKCFRFELLGCGSSSEAESNLTAVARSHGYLLVSWQCPNVTLPSGEDRSLDVRHYGVSVVRLDTGEVETYNTTDHSVIHPSPVYTRQYSVRLTCYYHSLALDCGQQEMEARPSLSLSCRAHSSFCGPQEVMVFRLPESVRGTYLGQGQVLVEWNNTRTGWLSDVVTLTLTETASGSTVLEREMVSGRTKVLLNGLDPVKAYQVNFMPRVEAVGSSDGVTASLNLLSHQARLYSFVSSVRLECHVLWSGGLRISWGQARARRKEEGQEEERLEVTEYLLELHSARDQTLVRTVSVPHTTRQLDLLGLVLSSDYRVTLSCQFPGQAGLVCGRRTVRISVPDLLLQSRVYRRLEVARSWAESEEECGRGGGHLVSLGHTPGLESLILNTLPLSDIWTGGNICPDSPAPLHSMWTDGSENLETNFAENSELEGGQCCVKTGARGWRGAACQSLLYGVCQYEVSLTSLLATPSFSITPLSRGLRLTWSCAQCRGWQPSLLSVRVCLTRRLEDHQPVTGQDCREVSSHQDQHLDILGLLTFAEYKLEITSDLEFFNLTSSHSMYGRTLPARSVEWEVTREGQLEVEWRERISHFSHNNFLALHWVSEGEEGEVQGLVSGVSLDNLLLGAQYHVTLTDLVSNTTTTFNFTAYCGAQLPAICYQDLSASLVFPEPKDFIRLVSEEEVVVFEPCEEAPGWRVNFTIDMWPSSSLSRNERGLDSDKLEVEGNRSSYTLDPDISYTALVTSQIGLGLTKQFTIPNIKAGIDLNMASYRVEYKLLPPSLVVGLIVSMSVSILVIGASLILFLLSQTCCLYSDNVAQICFQANLALCFVTAIVSLLSDSCTILTYIFTFFSLSAFTFLLVESLIILHKLVDKIMLEKLEKSVVVVLSGYLPPLVLTFTTLPFLEPALLTPGRSCPLDLSSLSSHLLTLPLLLTALTSLSVLVASVFLADDSGRRPISAEVFSRAKTLRKTRYSLMIISVVLTLWWLFSVLTSHLREVWLAAVLCLLCPALAVSVLTLRGLLDYQVINRIKRAYLKNKVSSVAYEDSKVIPSRKTTYNSPRIHKKSYQVNANPDPGREGDQYL